MIQSLANSLGNGVGLAVATVGLFLIYRATRHFHFAYGALYAASGVAGALALRAGVPAPLAVALSALAGAVLGVLTFILLYRGLSSGLAVMLTSFGLAIVVVNVLVDVVGSTPIVTDIDLAVAVNTPALTVTWLDLIELITGVVVVTIVAYLDKATALGWSVRAVSSDAEISRLAGISPTLIYIVVYAVGSALGGIAAGFEMLRVGMSPFSGDAIVLIIFMAVFIGRGVSLASAIVAAFAIELLLGGTAALLDARYQYVLLYGVLLLILVLAPLIPAIRARTARRRLRMRLTRDSN